LTHTDPFRVVYAYRWRDRGPSGHVKRSLDLGLPHSIITMAEAWEKAGGLKLSINPGNSDGQTSTFGP
jgi:hypothetical protein